MKLEKKQVKRHADWVGKTIERVRVIEDNSSERAYLTFADGTFALIQCCIIDSEDGVAGMEFDCEPSDDDAGTLFALGIIGVNERDRIDAEAVARNESIREGDLRLERAEYERLKAKFEPKPATDGASARIVPAGD